MERFRREAKAAAGLQHPNVVGVFDRGEHDGTYYIAMEHLPGRTLKDIVAAEAPLPQELVIDLGLQILAAAGFAHRHAVIHRDFKPHNVIVDDALARQGHGLRDRSRRRLRDDGDGLDHGHGPVPLARAGAGPRGGRHGRPLLDRRDALRDALRAAAVRGRQRGLGRAQAPLGAARADLAAAPRRPPRARVGRDGGAGQGPGAPLADAPRTSPRACARRARTSIRARRWARDTAEFAPVPSRRWPSTATPRRRRASRRSASATGPGSRSGCMALAAARAARLPRARAALLGAGEEGGAERGGQAAHPGARAARARRLRRAHRAGAQPGGLRRGAGPGPGRGRGGRRGLDRDARGLARARATCSCPRWPTGRASRRSTSSRTPG